MATKTKKKNKLTPAQMEDLQWNRQYLAEAEAKLATFSFDGLSDAESLAKRLARVENLDSSEVVVDPDYDYEMEVGSIVDNIYDTMPAAVASLDGLRRAYEAVVFWRGEVAKLEGGK